MSTDIVSLELTTKVSPAKKFLVDGEEYTMLTMDHLSKDDEAQVMALFARHSLIGQELEMSPTADRGTGVAKRLRNCRLALLTKLTDLPRDLAEKLPLSQQAKLLEALESEMTDQTEQDDDTIHAGSPQTPVAAAVSSPDADGDPEAF